MSVTDVANADGDVTVLTATASVDIDRVSWPGESLTKTTLLEWFYAAVSEPDASTSA